MISAIKYYRELTGAGLKEAKDAVEAIASREGTETSVGGCFLRAGVFLLIVTGLALILS